ncbi:hypothetical protein MCOR27_006479 [Pyricularia oryzae]|uniref:CRAL-TRIO domain-containing protein n=1 Tax=Pyricularia grisea TaxID=148305 RepID=A0ABQ8NXN2_PYRGI|nr:hypothetical protein MCOR01_007199 [Pyricularia oryzae]KAI6302644.1 hypothetical protein MCOR33_002068 [Pyricularia grisea]KAI6262922.1 hypothetical protein MCOR19_000903 [Pyricularia oryzae]KAI6276417.1 hypothetical protein MCOR27_006479 [Pyricularia oryzae]KAI6286353.1 hypothetical protein MCOR26_001056 [Pyricularia oryzae]
MIPRCRIGFHAAAVTHRSLVATPKPTSSCLPSVILLGHTSTPTSPNQPRPQHYFRAHLSTLGTSKHTSVLGVTNKVELERTASKEDPEPHRSSNSGLVLAALLLGITALLYNNLGSSGQQTHSDTDEILFTTDNMPEIPPGRPGNLTPEQDELLRKLWSRLFEVCGVIQPEAPARAPEAADADADSTKKKTRTGFFSRRKTDASTTNGPTQEGDPEDKYGQNKIFQDTLANMPPDEIRKTIWSMVKFDHPDALVLRFLRARKWDVEKALVMLVSSMYWRCKEVKVDSNIMSRGEGGMSQDEKEAPEGSDEQKMGKGFMAQLRMGKSLAHGEDKLGRPVVYVKVRLHKAADQTPESIERYTIFLIETIRALIKPPIDTATLVFDMTDFSMANMDYSPVKFMIKCFEANYPESLGAVVVHKAPWVFQGIWRIIRGWLDPVVAAKVNFTNDITALQEYVSIDKIPVELEGKEQWEYKYTEPIPGENDRMKDTATRDRLLAERAKLYTAFEEATLKMLRNPTDQAVHKERSEIASTLRSHHWQLDPYIRARSWYDRTGVLREDGTINYYPPKDFKYVVNGGGQQKQEDNGIKKVDSAHEKASIQDSAPPAVSLNGTA